MQESNQWDFQASLQDTDSEHTSDSDEGIDIQDTIDIQYTDSESEFDDSVHTSDDDFIDPQDDLEIGDYDPSYTDELSSLASSNNDFHGKLVRYTLVFISMHLFINSQWDKGKYDEFDILDKRNIEGANGEEVLMQFWVNQERVKDLLDLFRVCRQETPE